MTRRQMETKQKIEDFSEIFGIDAKWAVAVAMTESSLGDKQLSPTGCKGVFQMSKVAMLDLLAEMKKQDDDLIDIACGVAFLRLLLQRWGNIMEATLHFCAPVDRNFYWNRVQGYIEQQKEESTHV